MSHSPTEDRRESLNEYNAGWVAIHALLRSGASWSGRERNCCFLNTGSLPFIDVSAVAGLDFADDGRAVGVVDWDHDGRLDLWTTNRTGPRLRFLQNRAKTGHHFLAIRLIGTNCNRDAIGSRLELHTEDPSPLIKTLRAGDAFLSQSSKWVHFGLGPSTSINSLLVRWPDGGEERFSDLQVDRRYVLRQGSGRSEPDQVTNRSVDLIPREVTAPAVSEQARIVLANRLLMPPVEFRDSTGKPGSLSEFQGHPLLINLWSATCKPCLQELSEFAEQASLLSNAGLNILALNVDDGPLQRQAATRLEEFHWPFAAGQATTRALDFLDILQRGLLDRHRQLPLPSSFLIDAEGQLAVIYKGPIASQQLLSDTELLAATAEETRHAAAHFPGTWSNSPQASRAFAVAKICLDSGLTDAANFYLSRIGARERTSDNVSGSGASRMLAKVQLRLGVALDAEKKFDAAFAAFGRAVENDPGFAAGHLYLGIMLSRHARHREAIPHLENAVRINPGHAETHFVLGANHEALGNTADAMQHYRKVLTQKPSHERARQNLQRLQNQVPDGQAGDPDEN